MCNWGDVCYIDRKHTMCVMCVGGVVSGGMLVFVVLIEWVQSIQNKDDLANTMYTF
ncbi:MAG: hypothetical protein OEZ01_04855 [Candidatus Heimdallarchaeota archaeon]|nr:hypothetical protein [Candidatus Heimdallarchaeota archaeon]MDH5645311.1 hypothetical protein [Candidatus Heimdallarchaeota archaeon]